MPIDKSLETIKNSLLKRRQELMRSVVASLKKTREFAEFDGDDGDRANFAEGKEMIFAMGSRERAAIKAIDNALKNIGKGMYGVCEVCEDKISRKRLKVLPFTKYCIDCQAEIEEEKRGNACR